MPAGYAHFQIEYWSILVVPKCCWHIHTVFLETPKNRIKRCRDATSHLGTLGRQEHICTSWKCMFISICFKSTAIANSMSRQSGRQSLYRARVWLQFHDWDIFSKEIFARDIPYSFFCLILVLNWKSYSARNCSCYSHRWYGRVPARGHYLRRSYPSEYKRCVQNEFVVILIEFAVGSNWL